MIENFKFNKKFGQNFLSDKNLLDAIVSDAKITNNDDVLEIGAGGGALTERIALKAKKLISYEIDKTLTEHLKQIENQHSNLQIIIADALKTPISEIEKSFENEYKLVANLPYYITTPLIFKFLEETDRCKSLTVMVQKEVAERFCAKEKTKDYGVASIMINFYANVAITRQVSRNMFFPRPNVDSAVVHITKKSSTYDVDKNKFKDVVSTAFSMRRKTLINNLSTKFSKTKIEEALAKLNLKSTVRAEELRIEDFVALTNVLF